MAYPTRSGYSRLGGAGLGKRGNLLRFLPIALFGLYFLYYYVSNQESVPMTGRSQLIDMSREQEMALGLQSYQQILSDSQVLDDHPVVDDVREIASRLIDAARKLDLDPGFEWEVNVIRSDQANAFALPGGKLAVYTGIIPVAENEDALAAVMGHEIAHAVARHGAERMAHQKLVQFGLMAGSFALGDMNMQTRRMVVGAMGAGAQYGVLMPFSRKHESEADYMGLILLAHACYDPTQAPALWERMGASAGGKAQPEMMSTHPAPATRIKQFEEWMPEALSIREQNCSVFR
jgi:predicted Zn-dependent protease